MEWFSESRSTEKWKSREIPSPPVKLRKSSASSPSGELMAIVRCAWVYGIFRDLLRHLQNGCHGNTLLIILPLGLTDPDRQSLRLCAAWLRGIPTVPHFSNTRKP